MDAYLQLKTYPDTQPSLKTLKDSAEPDAIGKSLKDLVDFVKA